MLLRVALLYGHSCDAQHTAEVRLNAQSRLTASVAYAMSLHSLLRGDQCGAVCALFAVGCLTLCASSTIRCISSLLLAPLQATPRRMAHSRQADRQAVSGGRSERWRNQRAASVCGAHFMSN